MKPASFLALAAFLLACERAEVPPPLDSSSGAGSVEVPSPGELEVRGALESYYAALSARDWPLFQDHFWPGATLTTVWMPPGEAAERVVATTVPEFVEQAPQGPGSREIFEERLLSVRITVEGGLAQAWARFHARFGDPGDIAEWEGVDAFTLMRHQGAWKITSLAYRSDTP